MFSFSSKVSVHQSKDTPRVRWCSKGKHGAGAQRFVFMSSCEALDKAVDLSINLRFFIYEPDE